MRYADLQKFIKFFNPKIIVSKTTPEINIDFEQFKTSMRETIIQILKTENSKITLPESDTTLADLVKLLPPSEELEATLLHHRLTKIAHFLDNETAIELYKISRQSTREEIFKQKDQLVQQQPDAAAFEKKILLTIHPDRSLCFPEMISSKFQELFTVLKSGQQDSVEKTLELPDLENFFEASATKLREDLLRKISDYKEESDISPDSKNPFVLTVEEIERNSLRKSVLFHEKRFLPDLNSSEVVGIVSDEKESIKQLFKLVEDGKTIEIHEKLLRLKHIDINQMQVDVIEHAPFGLEHSVTPTSYYITLFQYALMAGNARVVLLLLEHGANPEAQTREGEPLVIYCKNAVILKILLAKIIQHHPDKYHEKIRALLNQDFPLKHFFIPEKISYYEACVLSFFGVWLGHRHPLDFNTDDGFRLLVGLAKLNLLKDPLKTLQNLIIGIKNQGRYPNNINLSEKPITTLNLSEISFNNLFNLDSFNKSTFLKQLDFFYVFLTSLTINDNWSPTSSLMSLCLTEGTHQVTPLNFALFNENYLVALALIMTGARLTDHSPKSRLTVTSEALYYFSKNNSLYSDKRTSDTIHRFFNFISCVTLSGDEPSEAMVSLYLDWWGSHLWCLTLRDTKNRLEYLQSEKITDYSLKILSAITDRHSLYQPLIETLRTSNSGDTEQLKPLIRLSKEKLAQSDISSGFMILLHIFYYCGQRILTTKMLEPTQPHFSARSEKDKLAIVASAKAGQLTSEQYLPEMMLSILTCGNKKEKSITKVFRSLPVIAQIKLFHMLAYELLCFDNKLPQSPLFADNVEKITTLQKRVFSITCHTDSSAMLLFFTSAKPESEVAKDKFLMFTSYFQQSHLSLNKLKEILFAKEFPTNIGIFNEGEKAFFRSDSFQRVVRNTLGDLAIEDNAAGAAAAADPSPMPMQRP